MFVQVVHHWHEAVQTETGQVRKKFPRPGFETSPMGPGFATFPNQFHFNISQMWQPSFIPKERPHQTLKLNQLKTFPSGLSRRTTTYWQSCRTTSRSSWKSLTPKMWPWGTTGGCAPATLRSQAEGCSARFRTSKRWFFMAFLLLSCVQNDCGFGWIRDQSEANMYLKN